MVSVKKLRILLIPVMAVFEIVCLIVGWLCILFGFTQAATRIAQWVTHKLPNTDWYLGRDTPDTSESLNPRV